MKKRTNKSHETADKRRHHRFSAAKVAYHSFLMAVGRNGNVKRNTLLGERVGLYYKAYAKSAGDAVPQFVEEKLKNAG